MKGELSMKINIQKKVLLPVVSRIVKGSSKLSTVPILQGIKLEVTEDGLLFTSSNGEITIQESIPKEMFSIEAAEKEIVFYPGKLFHDLLRKVRGNDIEIHIDSSEATIVSGRSKSIIGVLDTSEYPKLPELQNEQEISIHSDVLKDMVQKTAHSASNSDNRPVLKGIHITQEEGLLTFTATDSHRLSRKETVIEGGINRSVTVPANTMKELSSILEGDELQLSLTDRQMIAKFGNITFVSKILEGTYPETKRIIPETFSTMLAFNTKELLQVIEYCIVLANNQRHTITITHEKGNQSISFSSSHDKNKVEEEIYASEFSGESIRITFNAYFLLDILKNVSDEKIGIAFSGENKPFVLKPIESQNETYLILPIRTY